MKDYKLSEVIDVEKNQKLLESFCDAVGIAAAIIDLEGEILIGTRWQKICTDFHRVNERSSKRCIESDTELSGKMSGGESFSLYECKNGLTDAASPITIEGEHVANAFVGQFLLKPPDKKFFRRQAKKHGFDESAYMEALKHVPIVNKEKLPAILSFLTSYAEMVGQMGLDYLRQLEAEQAISRQAEEIVELSTPVIQIWEGVVIAPLIGVLDSKRTREFMDRFLNQIVATQSAVALIDITGVPMVDTQTAQYLIEAISGARLLGTRVILTGVRPVIAQTLVHLGIDLAEVETRSSLAAGLKLALEILDLEVVAKNKGGRS